jgi:cytochrome b6-f complex iron-sulfur subunit
MNKKRKISRGEFINLMWGASLLGLFGQAINGLIKFFKPRNTAGAFGGEVEAGNPEEFAPGTVSYVRQGRFYISRLEDGGYLALWQRCPHLGCTVPWRENLEMFLCPCHSSLFNPQGEVIDGPSPRPLDTFPISLQEGKLIVDTNKPSQRKSFDSSQAFYTD